MNNAKEYYNENSVGYVEKWDLSETGLKKPANYYRLQIINTMIELGKVKAGDKVLEIGCGSGLVLHELLKITAPIYGTDISTAMLERVRDSLLKNKKVTIVEDFNSVVNNTGSEVFLMQNDLLQLNVPKKYFDKIISMEVLRYIDDVNLSLKNVKEIMKDDSIFVFTHTNFFSLSMFPTKYILRKLLNKINKEKELLQYFVTEGSIKRNIRQAGFEIVALKKLNLLSFNPIVESIVKTDSAAKKIMDIDKILLKIPVINRLSDTLVFAVRIKK